MPTKQLTIEALWREMDFKPTANQRDANIICEFSRVVDCIEDGEFQPAPLEVLKAPFGKNNASFGTAVCRNCDARFSCDSYRQYAAGSRATKEAAFKQYLDDYGTELDPIALINGTQLVDLLIQYQVGVKQEQYTVPAIDVEYWSEVLGVKLEEAPQPENMKPRKIKINLPVTIRAQHRGETFTGELLELKGTVRFRDQEHPTPTTAAKVIVTDWKEVNGWDFWRYLNPSNGNWEKIGKLRE